MVRLRLKKERKEMECDLIRCVRKIYMMTNIQGMFHIFEVWFDGDMLEEKI